MEAQESLLGDPLSPPSQIDTLNPPGLIRFNQYSREEVSQVFEPGSKFIPQAGRWGISGIVETPKGSGNFVFLVTLGKPNESNPYYDAIKEDGYLIWESQSRHNFESAVVKKLLAHDPYQNKIFLFLRARAEGPYTYLGLLEYYDHDKHLTNPVHFVWKVRDWDLSAQELADLKLPFDKPLTPTYSPPTDIQLLPRLEIVDSPVFPPRHADRRSDATRKTSKPVQIDWAARDERNRKLGLRGERLVLRFEKERLEAAGRNDLAKKITHVAASNPSAGYDILSFELDGSPRHIEVKTTEGSAETPFYISANEVEVSKALGDAFWIYRVFDLIEGDISPKFFALQGPVETSCELKPTAFRAFPTLNSA